MVTNSIFNFDPPIFIFPKQGADYNWVDGLAIFLQTWTTFKRKIKNIWVKPLSLRGPLNELLVSELIYVLGVIAKSRTGSVFGVSLMFWELHYTAKTDLKMLVKILSFFDPLINNADYTTQTFLIIIYMYTQSFGTGGF